jgi:hypothetical protein
MTIQSSRQLLVLATAVTVLLLAGVALAKPATVKLSIAGANLAKPIEVTDRQVLQHFNVWHGHLDPNRRVPAAPATSDQPYEVRFFVKFSESDVRMAFVLYYYPNLGGQTGYIYLPQRGEKWHDLNYGTVQMATGWFRASRNWETHIKPLLARAEQSADRE